MVRNPDSTLPNVRLRLGTGDVIYLNLMGKSLVVLNSEEAARELLDKRSAIYSDRPAFPIFQL